MQAFRYRMIWYMIVELLIVIHSGHSLLTRHVISGVHSILLTIPFIFALHT